MHLQIVSKFDLQELQFLGCATHAVNKSIPHALSHNEAKGIYLQEFLKLNIFHEASIVCYYLTFTIDAVGEIKDTKCEAKPRKLNLLICSC